MTVTNFKGIPAQADVSKWHN